MLEISHTAFPYLKEIKKVRNKVHLQITRFEKDTDYVGIDPYDYILARLLLLVVLRPKSFDPVPLKNSPFSFLHPGTQKVEGLKEVLKKRINRQSTVRFRLLFYSLEIV